MLPETTQQSLQRITNPLMIHSLEFGFAFADVDNPFELSHALREAATKAKATCIITDKIAKCEVTLSQGVALMDRLDDEMRQLYTKVVSDPKACQVLVDNGIDPEDLKAYHRIADGDLGRTPEQWFANL